MTQTQLAYLAGLIDGEGYVRLGGSYTHNTVATKRGMPNRHGYPELVIANTDLKMIFWLCKHVPDSRIKYIKKPKHENHRTAYIWCMTGTRLISILPDLLPFLTTKREAVKLMIEYAKTVGYRGWGCKGLGDDIWLYREYLIRKIQWLHRRKKSDNVPAPEPVLAPASFLPDNYLTKAADAIREAAKPIHINEICRRIKDKHGIEIPKRTLSGTLAYAVKTGHMFHKTGPHIFNILPDTIPLRTVVAQSQLADFT